VGFHVSPTGQADDNKYHFTVDFQNGQGNLIDTAHIYYDWREYNNRMLKAGEPLVPHIDEAIRIQKAIKNETAAENLYRRTGKHGKLYKKLNEQLLKLREARREWLLEQQKSKDEDDEGGFFGSLF